MDFNVDPCDLLTEVEAALAAHAQTVPQRPRHRAVPDPGRAPRAQRSDAGRARGPRSASAPAAAAAAAARNSAPAAAAAARNSAPAAAAAARNTDAGFGAGLSAGAYEQPMHSADAFEQADFEAAERRGVHALHEEVEELLATHARSTLQPGAEAPPSAWRKHAQATSEKWRQHSSEFGLAFLQQQAGPEPTDTCMVCCGPADVRWVAISCPKGVRMSHVQ